MVVGRAVRRAFEACLQACAGSIHGQAILQTYLKAILVFYGNQEHLTPPANYEWPIMCGPKKKRLAMCLLTLEAVKLGVGGMR